MAVLEELEGLESYIEADSQSEAHIHLTIRQAERVKHPGADKLVPFEAVKIILGCVVCDAMLGSERI